MSQTWFRFELVNNAILIGAVEVPKVCPPWFSDRLNGLNATSKRTIGMDDVDATEYLEEACLQGRGIPVFRPLSPRSVPEPVFLPSKEMQKIEKGEKIDPRKAGIINYNQYRSLPEEARQNYVALQAAQLGLQPRMALVYDPTVDPVNDVEQSYVLRSSGVLSYVRIRDEEAINQIARHAYEQATPATGKGLIVG